MSTNRCTQMVLWTICLIVLSLSTPVQAESRFSEGFRGIAWQTPKDQLPDLGLSKKALKNIYKSGPSSVLFMEGKGNLELNFDGIPLLSIFLHFNDQLFTGVDLLFKPEEREKVLSILALESGAPTPGGKNGEQRWTLNRVEITVTDRELLVAHRSE